MCFLIEPEHLLRNVVGACFTVRLIFSCFDVLSWAQVLGGHCCWLEHFYLFLFFGLYKAASCEEQFMNSESIRGYKYDEISA